MAPGSILVLDLSGRFIEAAEPSILGRLLGDGRRPFVSLLSELAKAERDERLAGVVLRIRRLEVGWGKAQELRDAIAELREAGRPTLAYLETGSLGANLEYYVATRGRRDRRLARHLEPADRPRRGVPLPRRPVGEARGGLEAIGSGEYKSAAETIAGRTMSEAHREMATALLDSIYAQFVAGIAEGGARRSSTCATRSTRRRSPPKSSRTSA